MPFLLVFSILGPFLYTQQKTIAINLVNPALTLCSFTDDITISSSNSDPIIASETLKSYLSME